MKIEWTTKTKIPFSRLTPSCCFLDDNDNVCLACEDGWAVILATGEMFEPEEPDDYEVRLISAKVVVLEAM